MEQTKNPLLEDTSTPNEINIATTDENLSVLRMYQQTSLPSLGRSIFPVVKMHGPTAALFNIKTKADKSGFELVRADVEVENSEAIHTGITEEAVQDIRNQYGKEANVIIGNMLRGLANEKENTDTLAFLDTECLASTNLAISDSLNAQTMVMEIIQKVSELVMQANTKNSRTYDAFCVLPYKVAASFLGLSNFLNPNGVNYPGNLYVGRVGEIRFYMNPDPNSVTAYVGLTGDMSSSAAVFSPYTDQVIPAINADTGERSYHIYNRYAITASPLHEASNELMFKFDITI